jgi:DNA invertase Pin-like site-specific DNA recombinase
MPAIGHPYARISHPDQRKGGGLERQTQANFTEFCRRHDLQLSNKVWVDDGVSAFKGLNATPDHQLGQFIIDARNGIIRPNDCLILENWDRLSRQNPYAAMALVNDLRELRINIGRLDQMKLYRHDSEDIGEFFETSIEFMRGNSESKVKQKRNRDAWTRKRAAASKGQAILTHRLPTWIEERQGKLHAIPEHAAAIARIFDLSAQGYGLALVCRKLSAEGVPAIGSSGRWTRPFLQRLLSDRRVIGEFQPRTSDGKAQGDPIANYYPAIVTEAQWQAGRAHSAIRRKKPGRVGNHVNMFASLLKDARTQSAYYSQTRVNGYKHIEGSTKKKVPARMLIVAAAFEGKSPVWSFPETTFDAAILKCLKELAPHAHQILNGDHGPDESQVISGKLAEVRRRLADINAELDKGDIALLANKARQLEQQENTLKEQLAIAEQKAAFPLSRTWGEVDPAIADVLKDPNNEDVRTRAGSIFRRIIDSIWLLVVSHGKRRQCAAQIWFTDCKKHRDYLITHDPAQANQTTKTAGQWYVTSFAEAGLPEHLDLRDPVQTQQLEQELSRPRPAQQ